MKRVKQCMNEYKGYVKSQFEKMEEMKKSNMYSQDYLDAQEEKLKADLKVRYEEAVSNINQIIDEKSAAITKPNMNTAEYQAAISNLFTKVQLLGKTLTPKLLSEILEPAIAKQDNSTIQSVRSFIEGLQDFPGGDPMKKSLLRSTPRIVNQSDLLEEARKEIQSNFTEYFGDSISGSIAMNYLEQSGIFDL